MRRAIARRLTESKTTVPHFYLSIDVRMDALLELRGRINAGLEGTGSKSTVNDLVLKVLAGALRDVPAANAIWFGETIRRYSSVDVSVAIATKDGLLTPVLRDLDKLSISALSQAMADFKERAASGRIRQHELEGGAFSLTNLGMYGTKEFSVILNPPQSGILAVGAAEQRPVIQDGQLSIASVMTCTLSADHRVIDGAVGAELLAAFKQRIENPCACCSSLRASAAQPKPWPIQDWQQPIKPGAAGQEEEPTMTSTTRSVRIDIAALRPGDAVIVVSPRGQVCFRGEADETAPKLDVVWVRDHGRGERRIFLGSVDDVRLALPDRGEGHEPAHSPPNRHYLGAIIRVELQPDTPHAVFASFTPWE